MSIYATLGEIKVSLWTFPAGGRGRPDVEWIEIVFQGVPGHIGHPSLYETDPYADFLPPVVEDEDSLRAVVVIADGAKKGTPRSHQEYVDPLIVLTGEEWTSTPFPDLLRRIEQEVERRYSSKPA